MRIVAMVVHRRSNGAGSFTITTGRTATGLDIGQIQSRPIPSTMKSASATIIPTGTITVGLIVHGAQRQNAGARCMAIRVPSIR